MAGERVPPDDDLLSDDDDFILDDWDEELDIVGQVEAEVEQQLEVLGDEPQARSVSPVVDDPFSEQPGQFAPGWGDLDTPSGADADDVLFAGGGAESMDGRESFDPQADSTWEGVDATPQEMGLPISSADEVQEIELDDDEEAGVDYSDDSRFFGEQGAPLSLSQIQPGATAMDEPAAGDWAADGEYEYARDDGGYSPELQEPGAPEDADWEEEEEYVDGQAYAEAGEYEEYADDTGEAYAEDDGEAYAEDDGYEYEDSGVGYVAPVPVAAARGFIGGRQRRRGAGLRRAVATVAALLIVGLAGAVVVLKPEWLGVAPQAPLVDRTEVQRPQVAALTIAEPQAELFPEVVPPHDPVAGGSETTDPDPVVTPLPEPPPVSDPELGPVVEPPPVVATPEPVVETQPEDPVSSSVDRLVAVGEELRIGGRVDPGEGARAEVHPMAANLIAGSQAVVKLHNGNYFIGRVNKFDAVNLTLRVTNGELQLPFARVAGLASLSESEVKALENRKNGFVRLRNRNRLFGSIEDLGLVDQVVLSNGASRVIIPREAIEEIGKARADGVQVTDDLDDAWVRQMIENRLEERRQTGSGEVPDEAKGERR